MTRAPGGLLGLLRAPGTRWTDVLLTAAVAVAVELDVSQGGGPGAAPLNGLAYLLGGVLVLPILVRRRWPRAELIGCSVLLLAYYSLGHRRDISPAPLLSLPLYDAAAAGCLALAVVIPAIYMAIGLIVVELGAHLGLAALAAGFLPGIAVLGLAIMLGDVVRSRRALAAETAERLRLATEERGAEAARLVAEERLRIARDLHDTVAHSMATIAVQAGSALHLLDSRADAGDERMRRALSGIRVTSKSALNDMRVTLGQLRRTSPGEPAGGRMAGLDRLPALTDAVTAAGAPVSVRIDGEPRPLPPAVDQAAYRILQESLTNVLRHAGPEARAVVCLRYEPGTLAITVTDDGGGGTCAGTAGGRTASGRTATTGGHGLTGMAERVTAVGGEVTAGPAEGGGFEVTARLPADPVAAPAPVAVAEPGRPPAPAQAPAPGQGPGQGPGQAEAAG